MMIRNQEMIVKLQIQESISEKGLMNLYDVGASNAD
jgi:hypothetical protein